MHFKGFTLFRLICIGFFSAVNDLEVCVMPPKSGKIEAPRLRHNTLKEILYNIGFFNL